MSTHLQSQIDRLHRRIRMLLAPAVIKTTDDTGSLLKGQININGTPEVIDPIGIMYAYGFHANPLPNTDATALFLAGDRSNPIIVATNHQQSRPRNYKPGEIGIYTDEGDTVTLNRENKLNITSKDRVTVKGTNKVALDTPLTEISKDVKAFGKIDASEGFFKNGVAIGGGSAGPPGPQGPPGPPGPTGSASYQAGPGIAINTGTAPPTISTAVPYLPIAGGTLTGTLSIQNDVGSGYGGQWSMYNTAAGATNPAKYFRTSPVGSIEIINSAINAVIFQFTDSGAFALTGPIYMAGITFANQDANYHYLYDKSGRGAILMGGTGDNTNVHRNAGHSFGGIGGAGGTQLTVDGALTSQGTNAAYFLADRTSGGLTWAVYGMAGVLRFYNSAHGDLVSMDSIGQFFLLDGNGLFGGASDGQRRMLMRSNDTCFINDQGTAHCFIYAYTGFNINLYGGALLANMPAYKPGGGVWLDSSDVRLKHNIEDYTTSLDAILKLRPRSFEFNGLAETVTGHRYIGLVADEVEDIMPEMVGSWLRKMRPDDDEAVPVKTLDCTALTFALVNAVQVLAERLAAVEGRA